MTNLETIIDNSNMNPEKIAKAFRPTMKKFTVTETVKTLEKEIELPAYFTFGESKPSEREDFFSVICIKNEGDIPTLISRGDFRTSENSIKTVLEPSCWTSGRIISDEKFIQVPKSEWDLAVTMLVKEVQSHV